jgi:hypothetical protein
MDGRWPRCMNNAVIDSEGRRPPARESKPQLNVNSNMSGPGLRIAPGTAILAIESEPLSVLAGQ